MAQGVTTLPGASGLLGVFGSGGGRYFGFSARETAAAAASFRLREGSASGKLIVTCGLVASASDKDWRGPNGVFVNGDIYYEKVAGTIEGSVHTG